MLTRKIHGVSISSWLWDFINVKSVRGCSLKFQDKFNFDKFVIFASTQQPPRFTFAHQSFNNSTTLSLLDPITNPDIDFFLISISCYLSSYLSVIMLKSKGRQSWANLIDVKILHHSNIFRRNFTSFFFLFVGWEQNRQLFDSMQNYFHTSLAFERANFCYRRTLLILPLID